jgi:hypothetical protein
MVDLSIVMLNYQRVNIGHKKKPQKSSKTGPFVRGQDA